MSTRTASNAPFVAVLTISGGQISTNDTISTFVRGPVVWLVFNNDDQDKYTVEINYRKMKHKGGLAGHPFPQDRTNSADVPAAPKGSSSATSLVDVIKDYKPTTVNGKDTYEYTINLNLNNVVVHSLDPDIDVVDPYPLVDLVKKS